MNFYAMGLSLNVANGPGLRANWFHGGSLPGTSTYLVRFAGGWTYAILLNSRPNAQDDTGSANAD